MIFVERKKNQVRLELEALIADGDGFISPHRVVEWARDNPESKLHAHFEWDNEKAAHKFRLAQARQIIRVHIEEVADSGNKTRAFVSLERHRVPDEGYQSISKVLDDPIERKILVDQAKRELKRWTDRYMILEELRSIISAIENAQSGKEGDDKKVA